MKTINDLLQRLQTFMPLSIAVSLAVGFLAFILMVLFFIIGTGNPIP